jgi:hypothetical protein
MEHGSETLYRVVAPVHAENWALAQWQEFKVLNPLLRGAIRAKKFRILSNNV